MKRNRSTNDHSITRQNYEKMTDSIHTRFLKLKKVDPLRFEKRLKLSWSNWGFGRESLLTSAERLEKSGIRLIELHGNHYGKDLGYRSKEVLPILKDHGIEVSGICGMFSIENDLSSNIGHHRQAAIDYIKHEVEFAEEVGATYLLIVPGAVGRPKAYDSAEFERSVETLRLVADQFTLHGIKAAIEPIRSAETSLVHTIADAIRYIDAVDHPGVKHINADIYHMQAEERHIGEALIKAGDMLINVHMADSTRSALGSGSIDLDTIIRALYIIGFNNRWGYVTPEPLGPGGDPYPAMYYISEPNVLDRLVQQTGQYFRDREEQVLSE